MRLEIALRDIGMDKSPYLENVLN